jgi:hypothetical protein
MKKQFKILMLILIIPFLGFSNEGDIGIIKQKNIKKAYYVNADATVDIENSYGTISISTWDEDKIEIDILIKVSGDNEKWVNKRIDDITITFETLKSRISAITNIENSNSYNNGNNSFEINYTIKIPKNGSIKLNNKYGNISSTDITGNVDIACKYGKINLGKLNGNSATIQLGYCPNSTIEFVKNATIEAKYSGLKIGNVNKLNLDSSYTDVVLEDCQLVNYDSNYGKLKFENVTTLNGTGNYLTVSIGELFHNLKIDTNYSKIIIGTINEKANNVDIDSGYSDISVGFNTNYAFDFDISAKYAGIKYDKELEIINIDETNNSKQIKGFYKKKGINAMQISSRYGNINLIKKQ